MEFESNEFVNSCEVSQSCFSHLLEVYTMDSIRYQFHGTYCTMSFRTMVWYYIMQDIPQAYDASIDRDSKSGRGVYLHEIRIYFVKKTLFILKCKRSGKPQRWWGSGIKHKCKECQNCWKSGNSFTIFHYDIIYPSCYFPCSPSKSGEVTHCFSWRVHKDHFYYCIYLYNLMSQTKLTDIWRSLENLHHQKKIKLVDFLE